MKFILTFLLVSCLAHASANIVTLKLKNHTVQISNQESESYYKVIDKDGKVIANHATEEELAKDHPEVYEVVKTALAFPHETIDASLQRPLEEKIPGRPARMN